MGTVIKPWQQASLGVIASIGVYGVLLHTIQATASQAIHVKEEQQTMEKEHQLLAAQLQKDKTVLAQLHESLTTIHQQTLQVRHEISLVDHDIQRLKSGIQVASVQVSQASTKVVHVSIPSASVSPPPPVQTVTKASGV